MSYAATAGESSTRPPTGSSSVSTPQLISYSARDASCSPLSVYDEVPSPKAGSISHPSVADGAGFYMAPASDSKFITTDSAAYAGFAASCASQPWGYQGAVLPEPIYGINGAATWSDYRSLDQGCSHTLSRDACPDTWTLATSTELSMALVQSELPPPPSSQLPVHYCTAVTVLELKHPRPQRAFRPTWTAPDFDAESSLAVEAQRRGTSSREVTPPYISQAVLAVGQPADEDFDGSDSEDDMDEDWDDDLEFEENPGDEINAELTAHGPIDLDAGQGIGLGSSSWTLDSNSILYRPVATPLRCPSGSDAMWPPSMVASHDCSAVTPSFA